MKNSLKGSTFVFAALTLLHIGVTSVGAQAFGGERAEGVIVAVRADIVQIRPRFSDSLVRVVLDSATRINDTEFMTFDKLAQGWRVNVMGTLESANDFRPNFVMGIAPTERRTGFFEFPSHGIQRFGEGKFAGTGGIIKSMKPFVITDDDGKDITIKVGGPLMVMHPTQASKEKLLVGKAISVNGDRTSDGVIRARTINFNPAPGGGTLFGRVQNQSGSQLRVVPIYVDEPIRVSPSEKAVIMRQITLDPDTVQVGDTITAQGNLTAGTAAAPETMTASVLLIGKQEYPSVPSSAGAFPMFGGGGTPAVKLAWTGKVVSLAPLIIIGANDRQVRVVVPGQTPYVDLKPTSLSDANPGERIMLFGKEGRDGGLSASIILFGAGPITGFGG